MAPTVREDPKYQRIQQGAAEVDDYVLQEFLTDIIDSAPFNAAGNQTIQLLDQTSGLRQWQRPRAQQGCVRPAPVVARQRGLHRAA